MHPASARRVGAGPADDFTAARWQYRALTSRRPKTVKIAVWHNLPSGGGKRALYGHMAGLLARGHQLEAWCPDTADDKYLPLSELIPEHRLPFNPRPPAAGWRRKLEEKLRLGDDSLLLEMNRHSQQCAQAMLEGGFDLVFAAPCRFFSVPRLGHYLRGHGLPLSLYLQEPFRIFYEARPALPWIAPAPESATVSAPRRWWRKCNDYRLNDRLRKQGRREWEDARSYDLILVNSYFSRETIARVYGLDARVCYLGYDAARFHRLDPAPPRERFIVGLGSMDGIKGVATAIAAVGCLPPPRPPLVWVANSGDAAYRREMEALAAHKEVNFVVRAGVADGELVDILNRAGLLLYVSHLEPFGYAPLEANACGAPVVAVAEGGIRETVFDGVNGFLCDREPAALAQAMERLLNDPALTAELGAAGERLSALKWSPEQSIDRLEKLLLNLLAAKQSGSAG